MSAEPDKFDEDARLVLMDLTGGFLEFCQGMRAADASVDLPDLAYLYRKYRGWDGGWPTHDIATGRRLR